MDINLVIKLFETNSIENYKKIIEICDSEIYTNDKNADAYYLRGMARFGIALSVKFDLKLLRSTVPLGIASGLGSTQALSMNLKHKKQMDLLESHYHIADLAVKDYEYAISLDSSLKNKYNNLTLKSNSDIIDADYIFYRPISSKELLSLLAANKKWSYLLFLLVLWFLLPIALLYFFGDGQGNMTNTGVIIELICTGILICMVLFLNNIDTSVLEKYKGEITIISKH